MTDVNPGQEAEPPTPPVYASAEARPQVRMRWAAPVVALLIGLAAGAGGVAAASHPAQTDE